MMLGLSISTFTTLHVVISLIAIVAGLALVACMLQGEHNHTLAGVFLATTILTSVTGFMFPASGITPGHIFGVLSLIALAVAVAALYQYGLGGKWRVAYVVSSLLALYLNCFVGVVQSFQKVGFLARLAPTQSEPPFAIAQVLLLIAFVAAGWLAVRRFQAVPSA